MDENALLCFVNRHSMVVKRARTAESCTESVRCLQWVIGSQSIPIMMRLRAERVIDSFNSRFGAKK